MAEPYVRLQEDDLIEICNGSTSITFRRDQTRPDYWVLEKDCEIADYGFKKCCAHTFISDRDYPSAIGLNDRNGWSILEAIIKTDYYEWIDIVKARKGRDTVYVDLGNNIEGDTRAVMDFLETYIGSIKFWDYSNI